MHRQTDRQTDSNCGLTAALLWERSPLAKFFPAAVPENQLLKFLLVGIVNTVVGCGLMFLLYNCFNFSYWISSVCNYIAGGICSFFLNKYFTFQNSQKSFKQVVLFILNLAVCYFIAYIAAKKAVEFFLSSSALSEKLQGNIALFVGMVLYTILNYIGQRIFVFSKK